MLVDPLHDRTEIDIGEALPLELRKQVPSTAASIVGRVPVRQSVKERLERRLELRRVGVIFDPDVAARDARLDLLDPAIRERLRWLPRCFVDPATVLPVLDVPVRVVLRSPVEHRPHVTSLRLLHIYYGGATGLRGPEAITDENREVLVR